MNALNHANDVAGSIQLTHKEAFALRAVIRLATQSELPPTVDALIGDIQRVFQFYDDGTLQEVCDKLGDMGNAYAEATCECDICKARHAKVASLN